MTPLRPSHRAQGHPSSRTREEKRPHRFTYLVMRCLPASPLFASWPWPHHNWMFGGSSCYDRRLAESLEGQTVGIGGVVSVSPCVRQRRATAYHCVSDDARECRERISRRVTALDTA